MPAGEILSSTRVPLQPDHTACILQPANVAPHPSRSTPAVSNTQASSFPQLPTSSSSGQATGIQIPAPKNNPSHPEQITTPQPASKFPGQLATSFQQQTASLPLTPREPITSHPKPTATPVIGQLLPPTSLAHVPTPMSAPATAARPSQPHPQPLPVPPPLPPNLEMSPPTDLGAIPKTTSSPPLAHSELANASQIGISSNSYNRPPREKKRPTRLEGYHSGTISENSNEKPGFFSKHIGRSKST